MANGDDAFDRFVKKNPRQDKPASAFQQDKPRDAFERVKGLVPQGTVLKPKSQGGGFPFGGFPQDEGARYQDTGFLDTLASGYGGTPAAIAESIRHPIQTLKELKDVHLAEFNKAEEERKRGNMAEARAHFAAGLIPFKGPMASQIAEQVGRGEWGPAAANALMLLGPSVSKLLPEKASVTRPLGGPLRYKAERQYAAALNPTEKGAKFLSQPGGKLVGAPKGMLERGVMSMSERGLRGKISRKLQQSTADLQNAWAAVPQDQQVSITPILDYIQDKAVEKATSPVGPGQFETPGLRGRRIVDEELYAAYQNLGTEIIEKLGPKADQASLHSMRAVRQVFDDYVAESFKGKELSAARKYATRGATDAIRQVLNSNPSLAKVNAEYSFWKSAQEVMEATGLRRVGQRQALSRLATNVGRATGAAIGATHGYEGMTTGFIVGGIAGKQLENAFHSTAWKTVSAVSMNKIAQLLAQGKIDQAASLATRAAAYSQLRQTTKEQQDKQRQ